MEGKNFSHAYILVGAPEKTDKKAFSLAKAALCSDAENAPCHQCRNCRNVSLNIHPDVMITERLSDDKGKKREISVAQIRDIVSSAPIFPNEADRKVYIVRDAQTMNTSAQNAFLKCLEEPPSFVHFILEVQSAEALLETVRSRCLTINVGGEEAFLDEEALEKATEYLEAAACGDEVELLRFCSGMESESTASLTDFATATKYQIAEILCGRSSNPGLDDAALLNLSELMDKCCEYLRFNVGVKHILGTISVSKPNTIHLKRG